MPAAGNPQLQDVLDVHPTSGSHDGARTARLPRCGAENRSPFPAGELSGTHERITELVKHTMTDRLGSRERRNLLSEIDKLVATLFGVM